VYGNKKTIKNITTVAPGHEKDLSRVYLSFFDITELRQTQMNLQDYQKHLEDMVAERTSQLESAHRKLNDQFQNRVQFTRALVHELKTYLTPLLSASELLCQQVQDDNLKPLVDTIDSAITGLEHRVDDLLDLAKGEIGRLEVHCAHIKAHELIDKVARYAATVANINKQTFTYNISSDLPLLWADEERLTQILLNLLNNAFKYTPKGGEIKLSAWGDTKDFYVEVADNGPGIPQAMLPKIFSSYQLRVAERRVSSLGIGLPLAKMLAELHKGKIKARSEEGKGSAFTLILPHMQSNSMREYDENFNH
jgi:signal transduction histidine kinase